MIEQVRARVTAKLPELNGVVALRQIGQGAAPHLFREGDDLSQLVLTPRYVLASVISLLQKRFLEARFGAVVRGCDARALVEMAKRQQADPERLYLIGLTCTAEEAQECHCAHPAPDVSVWPHIEIIGTAVSGSPPKSMVAEYQSLPLEERRKFWRQQFLKCIKCYGCRNICPECFCESCALEDHLWVERGVLAPPFPTFHLIRAMHMTTRCVACRQCELTCPSHIPLTVLYDLMRQDISALLGYNPGADIAALPPLSLTLSDAPIRKK
ncbi:MAG: hypothetical protein ACUVWR_03230 [Anaerolineae bacterium]